MLILLVISLGIRFFVYRSGKADSHYFTSFARIIEKKLENTTRKEKVVDIDNWIHKLLHGIVKDLPDRQLRNSDSKKEEEEEESEKKGFRYQDKVSFEEYADGKRSILHSVKQNADAFKSVHPPHFGDLSKKILAQDKKWTLLFGIMSIDKLSRILDILPGLFIVCGIFGTFLGITSALPIIAQIDLSNIDTAAPLLNKFVSNVAFSMNTSLIGIICSVTMTLLNALYPITEVRSKVTKTLEYCFQLIWFKIHGEKVSHGELLIVEELKKINSSLSTTAKESGKFRKSA